LLELHGFFAIDKCGAIPGDQRTIIPVPHYQAFNEIPLVIEKTCTGAIKGLSSCFNCGDKKHGIRECKTPKDQNCIQLNIYLKREYEQSVNPVLKKN